MANKSPIGKLILFLLADAYLILLVARIIDFNHSDIILSDFLITVIAVTNFVIGIGVVKWLLATESLNEEVRRQINDLQSLEEAVKVMRSERHDFINHLQSIQGLLFTGDHNEAMDYLKSVGVDCRFNSQLISISSATLRTVLQNKKNIAVAKNIEFKLKIKSKLKFLNIQPNAITTVFGNLLDNAIDALSQLGEGYKKIIIVQISETETSYRFFIQNSGPPINEEVQEKMFMKGFSTKGSGRGYGLALVKDTVEKYGGSIYYSGEDKGFVVLLPKGGEAE